MKKTKFLCFLGLLCLFGSMISCKQEVAEPPPGGTDTESTAPAGHTEPAPVVIYGEIRSQNPVDSVEIRFWEHYIDAYQVEKPIRNLMPTAEGDFFQGNAGHRVFQWTSPFLSEGAFISLYIGTRLLWDKYRVMPGDTVKVLIDTDRAGMAFTGPSQSQYRIQYELALSMEAAALSEGHILLTSDPESLLSTGDNKSRYREAALKATFPPNKVVHFIDSREKDLQYVHGLLQRDPMVHPVWEVLHNYKEKLPGGFYAMLRADAMGRILLPVAANVRRIQQKNGLLDRHLTEGLYRDWVQWDFPDGEVRQAPYLLDYLLETNLALSHGSPGAIIELLMDYPGEVRERLLAKYLFRNYRQLENADRIFRTVSDETSTPWLRGQVEDLASRVRTGQKIMDTALQDSEGRETGLSGFEGKIVLMDFWFTGCKACLVYYDRVLKPVEEHFRDSDDLLILSISADKDKDRWAGSIAEGKYTSTQLVNLTTGGFDHPLLRQYDIRAFPSQILLDRSGRILKINAFPKTAEELIVLIGSHL